MEFVQLCRFCVFPSFQLIRHNVRAQMKMYTETVSLCDKQQQENGRFIIKREPQDEDMEKQTKMPICHQKKKNRIKKFSLSLCHIFHCWECMET